jgi:hypothetical protein
MEGRAGSGRQLVEAVVRPLRHSDVVNQLRELAIKGPASQIWMICTRTVGDSDAIRGNGEQKKPPADEGLFQLEM